MELGNLLFGNSRGNFQFPNRDIVNSEEWTNLMHNLLQVYDYHCSIDKQYFQNYENNADIEERTHSKIQPNKYGGFTLEKNGQIIFELFPYYWGDCSCGSEELNEKIEDELIKEIFTDEEYKKYISSNKINKKLKEKVDKFHKLCDQKMISHKEDCLLLKHNFVYYPNTEKEFWIDWYKYPFRDSYMNQNLSEEQILEIFRDCIKEIEEYLKE